MDDRQTRIAKHEQDIQMLTSRRDEIMETVREIQDQINIHRTAIIDINAQVRAEHQAAAKVARREAKAQRWNAKMVALKSLKQMRDEGKTWAEIGQSRGVSRERARQLVSQYQRWEKWQNKKH